MKNDTSPSARQPYSYANALHSLLIIPPSDRQPAGRPSQRGAHPDGRPAPEHHLQPPAPLWQTREVSVPPAPWLSLCHDLEGCTQPARHRSAVQAAGTDLLAKEPSLLWSPAGQVSKLSPKSGGESHLAESKPLISLPHPCR